MNAKKVLIITYYWPPAGGPGVQRWLKFVKYLPEFNIEPIVYCPENPSYPLMDESLVSEVSKDITVLKHPISEPYKFAKLFSKRTNTISKGVITNEKKQGLVEKLMLYIRGNFFIPDARKNWVKPSVTFLSDYIKTNQIETIITTGPPHSLHLIGLQLTQTLGVKWLADFRDPWTTIGYHKQLKLTKGSQNKHKALEKDVLNSADTIIVTSNNTKEEFKHITDKPITVITNGFDNEDTSQTVSEIDNTFSMSHIGSLLSKRNPEVLWKVLQNLIKELNGFSEDLQLNFVGFISESILKSISKYNLSKYVYEIGYISHNEAIKYQKKSQLLLLIEIDSNDTKAIIPGKLFEYMIAERPIIALGPKDTDVETILEETNTGDYFNYDDFTALKSKIIEHYNAFKKGNLQTEAKNIKKYSRKNLTKTLSKLI